jgi:hypothetical protein
MRQCVDRDGPGECARRGRTTDGWGSLASDDRSASQQPAATGPGVALRWRSCQRPCDHQLTKRSGAIRLGRRIRAVVRSRTRPRPESCARCRPRLGLLLSERGDVRSSRWFSCDLGAGQRGRWAGGTRAHRRSGGASSHGWAASRTGSRSKNATCRLEFCLAIGIRYSRLSRRHRQRVVLASSRDEQPAN